MKAGDSLLSLQKNRDKVIPLITDGPVASFSGFDVLAYWWYTIRYFLQQYPWQVRTSYAIILMCILTMFGLMFLFWKQIRKRNRYKNDFAQCMNTYGDNFTDILEDRSPLSGSDILDICDATEEEFMHYDGMILSDVIMHIRMNLHEKLFLTNLQTLCEVTGVRRYIERCLKDGRNVSKCLQDVCTLPLKINEGLLSIYTSNTNKSIQTLARIGHMIVSQTEPFYFLLKDADKETSPWYKITIHRILGWRREQRLQMAPIMMMAQNCQDVHMTSFLIDEVSYWGTTEEKKAITGFLFDKRFECRIAAVKALSRICLPETEDIIYQSYENQPQEVRRLILDALYNYHSGKYTQFFADIYHNTPSHNSRKNALECLYDYTDESHALFEKMYEEADEREKILFDQVRTVRTIIKTKN